MCMCRPSSPIHRFEHTWGISEDDLVIIFRPPATEAHYHRPESETLFFATVNYLSAQEDSRMKVVVLPRNAAQIDWMRETCPKRSR